MNGVATTTEVAGTTDGSIFEAIARVFEPAGAFASELRAVGFDVRDVQLRYPTTVLGAVLDVCARHALPSLPREEALRQIGQRMVEKFFLTIFGRVVRTLVQALGVERFLVRLPKIAPMGTSGLKVKVEKTGPGELRLFFRSGHPVPEFTAGTLDGLSQMTRIGFKTEIVRLNPWEFELRVTGVR